MIKPDKCFKGYETKCDLCGQCIRDAMERQKLIIGKAEAYDLLVEPLTELIFKYKEDKSLGSSEVHLYEQIESILSDTKRKPWFCLECGGMNPKDDNVCSCGREKGSSVDKHNLRSQEKKQ